MKKYKMYLVYYSYGSFEDFGLCNIFITESEELADAYLAKFNTKLKKWRAYILSQKTSRDKNAKERIYNDKYYHILEINGCYIHEIDRR